MLKFFEERLAEGRLEMVELAVLTHPDIDHVRGYGALLKWLRDHNLGPRQFWNSPVCRPWANALKEYATGPDDAVTAEELFRLLDEVAKSTNNFTDGYYHVQETPPGSIIRLGGGVEIQIIAPPANAVQAHMAQLSADTVRERRRLGRNFGPGSNTNLLSSAFVLGYGRTRALLTGDLMNEAWATILQAGRSHNARSHLFKVPHHGSKNSNFVEGVPLSRLVRVDDECAVAIISGGYWPDLPHRETLEALKECGFATYVTGGGVYEKAVEFRPATNHLMDADVPDVVEIVHIPRLGCGSITVSCNGNAELTVETQM